MISLSSRADRRNYSNLITFLNDGRSHSIFIHINIIQIDREQTARQHLLSYTRIAFFQMLEEIGKSHWSWELLRGDLGICCSGSEVEDCELMGEGFGHAVELASEVLAGRMVWMFWGGIEVV